MRTLIDIFGQDAASFLQGLITQDVATMQPDETRFSAMLSAQGKWQHDFFITRTADGFSIDILSDAAEILVKKLSLYKLRAKVTIAINTTMRCYFLPADDTRGVMDARDARLPRRLWQAASDNAPEQVLSNQQYHAERIALCIPEGGVDVTENETALDVSYDILGAISFTKGCYVGQEVTARMHYKAITRKGFFAVTFSAAMPNTALPFALVAAGSNTIAEIRSIHHTHAIAYGRFDAAAAHIASGAAIACENTPEVTVRIPDWQHEKYARFLGEQPLSGS